MHSWTPSISAITYDSNTSFSTQVKFHIMSHHELRRCSDPNISSMLHLNMEQLKKALTTLFDLYEANRMSQFIHKNETEFHACYVLLHLRSECQVKVPWLEFFFSFSFGYLLAALFLAFISDLVFTKIFHFLIFREIRYLCGFAKFLWKLWSQRKCVLLGECWGKIKGIEALLSLLLFIRVISRDQRL